MGCLLKWKKITSEASYDTARIYRSTSETGSYSLIASQSIEDNTYYDPSGLTTNWYKIEFYDSVTGYTSQQSDAIQGGTYYGYTTTDEIRHVTNLTSGDISDTHLATIIQFACTQLNADINVWEEEESIGYINETKDNEVNSVNTTFYTRHYPVGDSNNDFKVNTSDLTVYELDSEGTKTTLTVSSITPATGQFVLSSAPSSDKRLYVTYSHCQRRVDLPDTLIKMGAIMLSAALAYDKINLGKAMRFHMGSLTVFRHMTAGAEYYSKYTRILSLINDRSMADIRAGTDMPADLAYDLSNINNSGV